MLNPRNIDTTGWTLDITRTRDDADQFGAGPTETVTAAAAADYLEADPRHAIVIHASHHGLHGTEQFDPPQYVLRGAGENLDGFWYGDHPPEDPGDATGGDLTAIDAICAAYAEFGTE